MIIQIFIDVFGAVGIKVSAEAFEHDSLVVDWPLVVNVVIKSVVNVLRMFNEI